MEEIVLKQLKNMGLLGEKDDWVAKNEIEVNANEVIIKGNKIGLIMLADYLAHIAIHYNSGQHIHLDYDNFFDKANCELIIEKE
ncbi:MAG: hypothetical protein GXY43_04665 [Clostridiaceae bacterium]|nr:hypothetical protein [Clostridiaceae bacterium]